ncbi:uncharacterized protein LOC114240699 [Bombyx mandarina]|uniref:Uncharacterized protein n=2 Tax=Bombyx TaxID=7090 RepID=A0A8R1WP52_BOMMO|nr:uncharacterized protein LOC101741321 [Bombyx mori]XP_028027150.1 uncharacterized protein LOC114240699 [Bombyx mandarina]
MTITMGRLWVLPGAMVLVISGSANARVAGKMGGYSNKMGGKSTSGINEEIIWISISMAIAIAVLIAIALCYILREKCIKRQSYREQS